MTSETVVLRPAAAKEIVRRRLAAQRLSSAGFALPAEVVGWFGAMQAQDYLGALWAVGIRTANAREAQVEAALRERAIVRSWPMRGTLHFLAAADARWMIELLAPRALTRAAARLAKLGLDAALLSRARRALVKALEGGRRLTRPAVYAVLEAARVRADGERGLHVLWQLAHEGLLCFGPREGKQQTFVLLEEWLPHSKPRPRDDALAELALRYFSSHGPATLRDFAWWSSLTLAEARHAPALAGPGLSREIIAGETYLFGASAPPRATRAAGRAHALPAFDEFFVGYADRRAALAPAHAKRVTPFQLLGPVLLSEGRMVGTWQRRFSGNRVAFTTKPLAPLGRLNTTAVERALARYARFVAR
jgi:hypothetical protein